MGASDRWLGGEQCDGGVCSKEGREQKHFSKHSTKVFAKTTIERYRLDKEEGEESKGRCDCWSCTGALVGLIAILALVLFLLRRRKRAKEGETVEQHDESSHVEGAPIYQKDDDNARVEVSAVRNTELDGRKDYAYEMLVEQPASEMPAGPDGRRSER